MSSKIINNKLIANYSLSTCTLYGYVNAVTDLSESCRCSAK